MQKTKLQDWIGHEAVSQDRLRPEPARFMQATLNRALTLCTGDPLPPLWHWLYFLDAQPLFKLGRDGHNKTGGFLPPAPLPRRMWAGSRFRFGADLTLGASVERRSTIKSIAEKEGRSGPLCFVTVEHDVRQEGECALVEEHDIVYVPDRNDRTPKPQVTPSPTHANICEDVTPSEVMLFRYSALTMNGHRIHYDQTYASRVEGYAGLVVHGPLIATLLVDMACRQMGARPRAFSFRGVTPIDTLATFRLEGHVDGRSMDLWAKKADGALAMTASAEF